jgi:Domain of unknown function (DUF4189)
MAGTLSCLAHGSLAVGYVRGQPDFWASTDHADEKTAIDNALRDCRAAGAQRCQTFKTFQDTCMGFAASPSGTTTFAAASDQQRAAQAARAQCDVRSDRCIASAVCDKSPAIIRDQPSQANGPDHKPPPKSFFIWPNRDHRTSRVIEIYFGTFYLALLVVAVLGTWLASSLFYTARTEVLKRRLPLALCMTLPAAIGFWIHDADRVRLPNLIAQNAGEIFVRLWACTGVLAAVALGTTWHRYFSRKQFTLEPRNLLLYALPVAVLLISFGHLFLDYGFPIPSICIDEKQTLFHPCTFYRYEGFAFIVIVFIFLFSMAKETPADAGVSAAYVKVGRLLRSANVEAGAFLKDLFVTAPASVDQQIKKWKDERGTPSNLSASYGLSPPPNTGAIALKVRRSQRTTIFGRLLFVVDVRMGLSRSDLDLVRKYRLGKEVVYDSKSRQRHTEVMAAHLSLPDGQARLSDSVPTQLLSAAKTVFRLGRAGVRATAAALSLRITIESLLAGKHIECANLGEVMEAENAIIVAMQNLRAYLDTAALFDGREHLLEF